MKTIQIIRLVFALIFGFALMAYAGYAWHVEWINDWQALIVGTIGCAFAFVPHIIIKYLGKAIPKLFELTIGRFFNKPPKAGMLILFVLCSFAASAQYHNVKGVRVVHDNDSTIISGVGQIRYDQATGKFRFGNGASWFSFRRDDVPIAAGDMVLADVQTSTGKKTFQANGTSAGINISSVTSDPSTLVNADMWYNSFQGSPKIHISGTNRHLAYTTSQIANGVGYFAVSNNAQLQTDAQFNYVQAPTKILTVGTGGTSQIKTGNILFNAQTTNPSSPVNGQLWYNSTDGKLRGYQGGAVIDLGGSTYTAAQGLTLSGSEFRLGGTLTGGTLTQITSTAGNGIYFSMGSGVGTNTGSLQISPGFNILKHEDPTDGIVQYNLQDGIGVLTAKEHRVEITSTSTTNTVHMPLTVHSENSTFANGFGTGIKFQLSPLDIHSASITSQFESTSLGSEDTDLRFQTMRDGATPVDRVVITSDGRLYGTSLHNNTGDISGTTNQYVASGTYTPTLTGTTNVDAVVVQGADWVYMRVGNVVTVSGQINIDATAASTTTSVRGTLPIASAFANSNSHCAGTMVHTNSGVSGAIRPEPTNDEFQINFSPAVTSAQPYSLTFTYVIL